MKLRNSTNAPWSTLLCLAVITLFTGRDLRADDHGDTLASASVISSEDTTGELDTLNDLDWFRLDVTIAGRHWIYTTGGTDTLGTLYDETGNFIDGGSNDDDAWVGRNFYLSQILQVGTYYIRIEDGTQGVQTGAYTLSVRHPQRAIPFGVSDTTGSLDVLGDLILYRIELTAPDLIWTYTTGGTDTEGTLYDVGGSFVDGGANDDNAGSGFNFRFSRKLLPGTYYLLVGDGGNGDRTGEFGLSWRSQTFATNFAGPDREGALCCLGELDYYRFTLSQAGPFWCYTTGTTDTFGTIYDSAGNYVDGGSNESDAGAGDNFLISNTLQPGSYYLLVEAGGTGDKTGDYQLHLRDASRATPLFGDGDSIQSLEVFGDHDLFVFSTAGGDFSFSTTGTTDTFGTIYGSGGGFEDGGSNDHDRGSGDNFLISGTLFPGDYYLLVRGASLDFTTGGYVLESTFNPADLTRLSGAAVEVSTQTSSVIEVRSSTSWQVTGLPSWITASSGGGNGDGQVVFSYSPNLSGLSREATILVGGQAYTVTQRAAGDTRGTAVPAQLTIAEAIVITVPTQPGVCYKVETSSDMVDWIDTGIVIIGDGTPQPVAFARSEVRALFRALPQ